MSELPEVRPGQVWESCDKRDNGRRVKVLEVFREMADGSPFRVGYAIVEQVAHRDPVRAQNNGRRSKIRLDRFRPTSSGYRLVSDTEETGGNP
jgi:hypothetical protein